MGGELWRAPFRGVSKIQGSRSTAAPIARRSSGCAAVDRAQFLELPNGEPSDRESAEKRLNQMGEWQLVRLRCTPPYETGVAEDLFFRTKM